MAKSGGGGSNARANVVGMVLVRIFLGVIFLAEGIARLTAQREFSAFLQKTTAAGGAYLRTSAWDGYANFLLHTVHAHIALFTWMLILGGLLAGALFLLGLLTRLAAILAMLMSFFFLFAVWGGPMPYWSSHAALLIMALATLIAAPGRTWGIDAIIARRTKVKILW